MKFKELSCNNLSQSNNELLFLDDLFIDVEKDNFFLTNATSSQLRLRLFDECNQQTSNVWFIAELLKKDINLITPKSTFLHYAAYNGNDLLTTLLVQKNRSLLNCVDVDGNSPLHSALNGLQVPICSLFENLSITIKRYERIIIYLLSRSSNLASKANYKGIKPSDIIKKHPSLFDFLYTKQTNYTTLTHYDKRT